MVKLIIEVVVMGEELITRIFLMILITFLVVAFIMPFIKKLAFHIGALDIPRSEEGHRHIHKKTTPKLGGLAMFIGFLFSYMIFGEQSSMMNSILIGSFLIVLTGIIDDIHSIKASVKFAGQLAAACVVTFYGGIVLQDVSAFGFYIDFGVLAYPITVLFIVACINCMNLIDGLDGLAGGISAIYYLTIGIIAVIMGNMGLDVTMTFIMFGATLGFLVHNFHPATVFAGDSGSMFMGFMVSVIALLGFKNVTLTSFIIPLLILAIPILDTLFAIVRRRLKGESFATPDKSHIHHQFLNMNLSYRTSVLIIYGIQILFAIASIVYVLKNRELGYILYTILVIIVMLLVLKTDVVFNHKDFEKKFKLPKK